MKHLFEFLSEYPHVAILAIVAVVCIVGMLKN